MSEFLKKLFDKASHIVAFCALLAVIIEANRVLFFFFPDSGNIAIFIVSTFVVSCYVRFFTISERDAVNKYKEQLDYEKRRDEYYNIKSDN